MPLIKYEKCDINFVRTGPRNNAPLIFLHPVGLDLTWWSEQFAAFGSDHDLVAFDMPGHGLSGKPQDVPSFGLMADVLEQVLESVGGGAAHLVGISVGGMIAQTFALRRPDLVRSLSLVATLCAFPDPVREALRMRAQVARTQGMAAIAQLSNERWFPAAFRAARPDMLDRATRSLLQQDPEFHASMWDMIAGLDLQEEIRSIHCPTLVIAGAEDPNAPVAAAWQIAHAIPGASLSEMQSVGHFPPFEAPDAFNAILRGFIAHVEESAAKD